MNIFTSPGGNQMVNVKKTSVLFFFILWTMKEKTNCSYIPILSSLGNDRWF